MAPGVILASVVAFTLTNVVKAQGWGGQGGRGWNGNGNGDDNPWWNGNNGNNDDDGDGSNSSSPSVVGAQILGSTAAYNRYNSMLIAHAVLASLVWVIFVPWAALLLRINLKSSIVLKLHALFQIISYIIFLVAAGLGVWLAQRTPAQTWQDPHPRLGLAILGLAFLQPVLGTLHHRIFKRRTENAKAGRPTKPPGRTTLGHMHIWLGRSLIVLGVINGGLGIRLAGKSPFQTDSTTRKAVIVYAIVAAAMFLLYAILVVLFEVRRRRAQATTLPPQRELEKLPTYDESQSSQSSLLPGPTRYQ